MHRRVNRAPRLWHLYLLAIVGVAAVALAILEIGPPTSSARTARALVTASQGVVQSTVSGTGNVEAGSDVNVNFATSGTLQQVYVSSGQHVKEGQLIATLDPASAQLSLDQAQEQLTAAEDQLTAAENGTSSGSGGSGASGGSGSSGSGSATGASLTGVTPSPEFVSLTRPSGPAPKSKKKTKKPGTRTVIVTRTVTTPAPATSRTSRGTSASNAAGTTTQTSTTPSPASIASAEASVYGAEASVRNAQIALSDTRLYAPINGTIASLSSMVPGDSVSAGASTNGGGGSSSSSSSSSGSGSSGSSTAGSLGGGSGSSGSGGSSSSAFAEIVNAGTMTMTVAFSESDISKVRVGKPATVTFDALPGVELGAHVSQISAVGSSSSGVVSYDATLTLDQHDAQVRPGMSASASVITSQAQGVTLPNAAVTGAGSLGTVNLLEGGKTVTKQVVVGLRGDSRTQIISGLKAGQQLVITISLPPISSSTGSTGGGGTLGGAGKIGGGLGGGLGGGGGGFFRRAFGGGG